MVKSVIKISFLYFMIVVLHHNTAGQTLYSISNYSLGSAKMTVGIKGEFQINSTALTTKLYDAFIFGKYIDNTTKDAISKRLVHYNKIGADLNSGLYFAHKIDTFLGKTGYSYFCSINDRQHGDALFTEDLFKVGFYGNKGYENDTAELGSLSAKLIKYQQLQFGMIKKKEDGAELGFGISFLKGQEFFQMDLYRGDLFTSTKGNYIDLDLLYQISQSNQNNKNWDAMNGWGFSGAVFYNIPYNMFQSSEGNEENIPNRWHGYLRMEAYDLGFIRWNNNSLVRIKDSTYHYDGIEIYNLLQIEDSVLQTAVDSLEDMIKPGEYIMSFTSIIPGTFHLKMHQESLSGGYFALGTILRMFANYSPTIYLKGGHTIKDNYRLGGSFELGGYGKFNIGIETSAHLGSFELALGSRSIMGFILPEISGGVSLFISVKKSFN